MVRNEYRQDMEEVKEEAEQILEKHEAVGAKEELYVVYEYTDYRKEFSSKILRVYKSLDSAIEYAERKCVNEDEDQGVEYVCQSTAGQNFDRKKVRTPYTRIGISGARYYTD